MTPAAQPNDVVRPRTRDVRKIYHQTWDEHTVLLLLSRHPLETKIILIERKLEKLTLGAKKRFFLISQPGRGKAFPGVLALRIAEILSEGGQTSAPTKEAPRDEQHRNNPLARPSFLLGRHEQLIAYQTGWTSSTVHENHRLYRLALVATESELYRRADAQALDNTGRGRWYAAREQA